MFILLRWLIMCLVIAIVMKPLFPLGALRPADGGFSISLGLGTGVLFTAVWFVCALTHLTFDSVICVLGLSLFFLFFILKRKKRELNKEDGGLIFTPQMKRFLTGFAVFSLLFIIAFWVKGFKPFIDSQTEQYMDYGFMNAMYRQKRVPFEDIWFAGKRVNYYYLGQAVAVFMCRLSFVTPEYGYNLMLCTIFASLSLSVFSLVDSFLFNIPEMKRIPSAVGGIAASLMCACGGNGHWIIYGIIGRLRDKLKGTVPENSYWFPTSTLFIGYDPDTLDKAKHEFPSYTLVLGDLHAHVCNMLFTIPFLLLLFDYALSKSKKGGSNPDVVEDRYDFKGEIFDRRLIIMGIILGLFKGVNFWDFPIYFVVSGAVILFCDFKRSVSSFRTVITVLIKGLLIYLTGVIVMLPFTLGYSNPSSGIHLCDRHTPVDRFIIIWFVHLIIVITLLIYISVTAVRNKRTVGKCSLSPAYLLITAVSLCGLGLLLMPELIYVKDIYGDEFQRYNTMFKLTFQGFILLSVSAGICIGIFLNEKKNGKAHIVLRSLGGIYFVAALLLSAYMGWSVRAWFGNIFDASLRKSISASDFIKDDPNYDNVREAINILAADPDRRLHIIEEAGNSYQPESRLSVFTGAVTVAGWYVHEWVWRNDGDAVSQRHGEVKAFYTGGDEALCLSVAEKYDLDYIYVGPKTIEKYDVNYEGFKRLGEHIWESDDGRCMLIRTDKSLYDKSGAQ